MTETGTPTTEPPTRGESGSDSVLSRRTFVLVFLALMLSMLLASLNNTLIAAATPTIVGELNGVDQITWVVTAFIVASTIMMPIYGNLSDLLGRKSLLISAIVIFMAGSVVGALAWDINVLIVARVVQGLGGGGLIILSQATIADVVPARQRGQYMGIMGSVFAFSSVAGPLVGGWLTDGPGWRWAFWINIPVGLIALAGTIIFLRLPQRRRRGGRIDYWGMMLLATATTAFILMTVWGGTTYPWLSPVIIGLILVTILAGVAFVLVERKASQPVIPLHMFRHRNFVLTTIASFTVGIAMFGAIGYMPTFLQMTTGLGAAIAGLLMVPMMGTMLVTGIVVGRLVTVTGRYKWAPMAGTLIIATALVLLGTVTPGLPIWVVCIYLGILGLGIGTAMQILTLIVQNEFPNAMVGTATASNNFFRQVGASLGSAVVGAVFAARLTDIVSGAGPGVDLPASGASALTPAIVWDMPEPVRDFVVAAFNDALMPIYLWISPIVLIGFIITLFLREKPLATTIERDLQTESLSTGQVRVYSPESDRWDAEHAADDDTDSDVAANPQKTAVPASERGEPTGEPAASAGDESAEPASVSGSESGEPAGEPSPPRVTDSTRGRNDERAEGDRVTRTFSGRRASTERAT